MQEFINIFSGLRRRYGYCNVQNAKIHPATGKKYFEKKDYGWSKTELKDEDYIEHLNGTRSIGIQPCDDNDQAVFGAIDIDPSNYSTFSPKKYLEIIDKKQLKWWITFIYFYKRKSKSIRHKRIFRRHVIYIRFTT